MKSISKMLLVMSVAASAFAMAQNNEVRLEARMTGRGSGHVQWRTRGTGTQMRSQISAEGEHLPPNAPFALTLGNNTAFAVATDAMGRYHIEMSFRANAGPTVNVGDSVTLSDSSSTIVQSGIMQVKNN
jgi:hypothetical protein